MVEFNVVLLGRTFYFQPVIPSKAQKYRLFDNIAKIFKEELNYSPLVHDAYAELPKSELLALLKKMAEQTCRQLNTKVAKMRYEKALLAISPPSLLMHEDVASQVTKYLDIRSLHSLAQVTRQEKKHVDRTFIVRAFQWRRTHTSAQSAKLFLKTLFSQIKQLCQSPWMPKRIYTKNKESLYPEEILNNLVHADTKLKIHLLANVHFYSKDYALIRHLVIFNERDPLVKACDQIVKLAQIQAIKSGENNLISFMEDYRKSVDGNKEGIV